MSSRHARNRILLSFVFGIALPSGLLAYLAFRGIQNDQALVEREQRTRLQEIAVQIRRAVEGRLDGLEQALASVIASADSLGSDVLAGVDRLVWEEPLVQAVFSVEPAGPLRVVATRGLRFEMEPEQRAPASTTDEWTASFHAARTREFRSGDLQGSLMSYQRLTVRAANDRERGEALNAVARVQRKLGNLANGGETYKEIRDGFGHVRMPSGLPLGAAAGLEYGAILLEAGDSVSGANAYLEFYQSLVDGRWSVTPAHFEMLAGRARQVLEGIARSDAFLSYGDTVAGLIAAERVSREHAESLLEFQVVARSQLDVGGGNVRRSLVGPGGRAFHTVLLIHRPSGAASIGWGLLLDVGAFARDIVQAPLPDHAGRVVWALRTQSGDTLAASGAAPPSGSLAVTASLGDFPPWSLQLSPQAIGLAENFLISRRAVYLYAFVLLAGILLFGLVLTIRSITRELELARMQSDFVSTVSHEFKSPLTAIRQLAEMLKADMVPSEDRRRRYYDVLVEQSERLSMLIDNVLDFARMDEGRREMSRAAVDVRSLVEDIVTEAQHRVVHEGFTVRAELEDQLPRAFLDADAIRQALNNLIDNGVKYSGSSREVVVRSFRENAHIVIAVRDFGIGLAPEEANKVFDRFYRGGGELTRSVKGTGLGLTLVKQIVGAHGGDVHVHSELGRGSTFSMRLPLVADPSVTHNTGGT